MPKLLIIDDYDSFTFNLSQAFQVLGAEVTVRADQVTLAEADALEPTHLCISPGPGRPEEAGVSMEMIAHPGRIPILGVCLGHQSIATVFGGEVVSAKGLMHGRTARVSDGRGLSRSPNPFQAGRVSLLAVPESGSLRGFGSPRTPQTVRSWAFATRPRQSLGCNFIPSRS